MVIIIILIKKVKAVGILKDHGSKKEKKARHVQCKMHLSFCYGSSATAGTQQPDFIHEKTFKEPGDKKWLLLLLFLQ